MPRKYPEQILKMVRQRLELAENDRSQDQKINEMSPYEVFDHCLHWEGIIGYTGTILSWFRDIYNVDIYKKDSHE